MTAETIIPWRGSGGNELADLDISIAAGGASNLPFAGGNRR
jgi:hypothetical protein